MTHRHVSTYTNTYVYHMNKHPNMCTRNTHNRNININTNIQNIHTQKYLYAHTNNQPHKTRKVRKFSHMSFQGSERE